MFKSYEMTLENGKNTINLDLRINAGAQKAMQRKYKEEPTASILSAVTDIDKMTYIFGLALSYKGNENAITDGEEFYDLLVDNGYAGQSDFMKVLTSVAATSGLISEKQKKQIDDFSDGVIDKAFEETLGEDDEKNAVSSNE